jgi:transcriptional regulator with XRE-family HTH domain
MPLVYLTKEDRLNSRLATYIYGELKIRRMSQASLAKIMGISRQALTQKLRRRSFSFTDFVTVVSVFEPDEKELNRLVGMGE